MIGTNFSCSREWVERSDTHGLSVGWMDSLGSNVKFGVGSANFTVRCPSEADATRPGCNGVWVRPLEPDANSVRARNK